MTEKEFWKFLETAWAVNGREAQLSMTGQSDDPEVQKTIEYIGGHSLLPKGYDKISKAEIIGMGGLLFDKSASAKTKEAILMILAHHGSDEALDALKRYNLNPDPDIGLRCFAKFALDECYMWNE